MTNQPAKGPYSIGELGGACYVFSAEGVPIAAMTDVNVSPTAHLLADSWEMRELLRKLCEISLDVQMQISDWELSPQFSKIIDSAEALLAKYEVEK